MEKLCSLDNFDLDNAVNVTLIFDDCDENSKPTIHILETDTVKQDACKTSSNQNLDLLYSKPDSTTNKESSETTKRIHKDEKIEPKHAGCKRTIDFNKAKLQIAKKKQKNNVYDIESSDNDPIVHVIRRNRINTGHAAKKTNTTKSGVERMAITKKNSFDMPLLNGDSFLVNPLLRGKKLDKSYNSSLPDEFLGSKKYINTDINIKDKTTIQEQDNLPANATVIIHTTSLNSQNSSCGNNSVQESIAPSSSLPNVCAELSTSKNQNQFDQTKPLTQCSNDVIHAHQTIITDHLNNGKTDDIQNKSSKNFEQGSSHRDMLLTNNPIPQMNNQYINSLTIKYCKNISNHLISVWKSFYSYMRLLRSRGNFNVINQAKHDFMFIKRHFFDLAYSFTLNIILPRENDIGFLNNFINSTVELAISQSHHRCCHQDIQILLKDLIKWTKIRKQNVDKLQENIVTSHPMLQKMLVNPQMPMTSTGHLTNTNGEYVNFNMSLVPTYSNNATGTHSVVPQEKALHAQQMTQCAYSQPFQHLSSQSYSHHTTPVLSNQFEKPTDFAQQPEYTLERLNNAEQKLVRYRRLPSYDEGTLQKTQNLVNHRYENMQNSLHNNQALHLEHSGQGHLQDNKAFRCENSEQGHSQTQHPDNFRTEQEGTNMLLSEVKPDQLPQGPINSTASLSEPQNQRSSLSRDSGFMSPLNFKGTSDQMCNVTPEKQGAEMTPLITHVTSLNAKASYIREGVCSVCGKRTKTMCLGCYNCYYCSSICQYRDWSNHAPLCQSMN